MESQNRQSERFTWEISDFSKLTTKKICSEVFTVDGCKWQIMIYPKPANSDFISVYLKVPDHASLPVGWSRTVDFSLTVVSPNSQDSSITKEGSREFTAPKCSWGFSAFMSRTELISQYLAKDALVVEANIAVLKAVPQVVQPALAPHDDKFVSHFDSLDEIVGAAETSDGKEDPTPEEVEDAKQCLKECLSSHFELNMKERLASALSTLSVAEAGISPEQRKSILEFLVRFDDYISDYLTLQQDSSVYEIHKLQSGLLFSAMKKNRARHLSYKEMSEKLSREEEELHMKLEELKKQLDDTRCRKLKLVSDCETLIGEAEELKSKYVSKKPRLAEAEERKRISRERLSHSTTAWANLKAQFL